MPQIENTRRRDTKNDTTAASPEAPFPLQLPALEDAASIQRAISLVVDALATGALEASRARTILYGLQIASSNARRLARKDESNRHDTTEIQEAATIPEAATTREVSQTGDDDRSLTTVEEGNENAAFAAAQPEEPRTESTNETQKIDTPSASTHIEEPREAYIPPSCSSRTVSYQSNARDRLLAFKQKGLIARDVTHDISR